MCFVHVRMVAAGLVGGGVLLTVGIPGVAQAMGPGAVAAKGTVAAPKSACASLPLASASPSWKGRCASGSNRATSRPRCTRITRAGMNRWHGLQPAS